ncbi:MAG TPA: DUF6370 family protein [Thermoanaerobaculia bacterium]|nr:DUF6370 family protein [Thermoanaerobaculia bacterium]
MRSRLFVALALVAALGIATAAFATDVTLSGKIACAKCTMKKADAKACQDVLVVAGEKGATTEYYIVKNAVFEKFGHTCSGEKAATVTGIVSEKDGKKWITPSKMDAKS